MAEKNRLFQRRIKVQIDDLRVAKSPHLLVTTGIGSCVAVAIYEYDQRLGGLSHISLPAKTDSEPEENLHKYAEIAVESLLGMMESLGGEKRHMVAKIAGGSNMFTFESEPYDMGCLNVAAVRGALQAEGVVLVGEDVFGYGNRNLTFDLADGSVTISTPDKSYAV